MKRSSFIGYQMPPLAMEVKSIYKKMLIRNVHLMITIRNERKKNFPRKKRTHIIKYWRKSRVCTEV